MKFFSKIFRKIKKQNEKDISIHENLSGNFFYHIAINDIPLCGDKKTMRRQVSVASWGIVTHLKERYCKKCEEIWIQRRS